MRYSRKYIEEMKQKIPKIAYGLFEQNGMDEVTMQDVAQKSQMGVATMYRYYGTKAQLVVASYMYKWNEITEEVTEQYKKLNKNLSLYDDFEFCLNSVLYVYKTYSGFLRFIQNFMMYAQQNHLNEDLKQQISNLSSQSMQSFHALYNRKIDSDQSIRKDIPIHDLYVTTVLSLYYTASKYSIETLIPLQEENSPIVLLELQKRMYLDFIQKKTRS